MKNKFLICYDIANNKRRRKLVKILEEYGIRLQYSIFRCELSNDKIKFVAKKLVGVIKKRDDSLMIIPINNDILKRSLFYGTVLITLSNSDPNFI